MFEPTFTNRDENGMETNIDGFGTQWDKKKTFEEYNTTYVTSEAIEVELPHEEIIEDQN